MANSNYSRKITCDFFRIQVGDKGRDDFLQIVQDFHSRCTRTSARNFQVEDGYVRLHDWRVDGDNASGALLRLRTDGNTRIGHIETEDLRDLQLGSGEALADYSCFRFFGEFKTLVVHRNRDAGTESRLRHYLEQKCGVRPIDFGVLISADALKLFERMQEITIAEISIAVPTNLGPETEGRDVSVNEQIALARRAGAAIVKTRLSMGHTRRTMAPDFLKRWFGNQLEAHSQEIRSAEISGRLNKGEDVRTIDLIQDRIREKVKMETGNVRPTLADFYTALEKAYENRREEISKQFHTS